ncbi:MAG: acyl-CoA thioesterase [Chitinophagaceae bacterium]
MKNTLAIEVRWSDLDPNVHVRHSVYYDWGAQSRIRFFNDHNVPTTLLQKLQVGPILFREECVFKREVRLGDLVTVDLEMVKSRRDYSRWTMRHSITKNRDTLAAIITVDAAWLDIVQRKLVIPPKEVADAVSLMTLAGDFEWTE